MEHARYPDGLQLGSNFAFAPAPANRRSKILLALGRAERFLHRRNDWQVAQRILQVSFLRGVNDPIDWRQGIPAGAVGSDGEQR
jgi:hypothetical protein